MMFRHLLLVPALLLSAPAAAQQATAAQNLDCAIWSAYQVGVSDDEDDRNVLSIAFAWFIGLYEGQTGQPIDTAMEARSAELDDADVEAIGGVCMDRFAAFSERLGTP